jgi:chemotaxis protein histidine kinase CheA
MIHQPPFTDDLVGLDRALMEQMLDMGGSGMRPALVAQLLADFTRISGALEAELTSDLERAAHELKGLAGTIGAAGLAASAARFGELASASTTAVRAAQVLGQRGPIEAMCTILRAQATPRA